MFEPTEEQSAIVDVSKSSNKNLRLIAYAGAAKTTTLDLIAKASPGIPTQYLVFNKRNADEAKERLPSHVQPMTFNSCGHRAWSAAQGRKLTLNPRKTGDHLKVQIEKLPKARRWDYFDQMGDIIRMIDRAKTLGYIPEGKYAGAKALINRDDFESTFEEPASSSILSIIDETLTSIIAGSYAGEIDFSDQIYMPTLFGGSFPKFPRVLVDESQDLSPLNHAMLRKLVTKRVICVGDPYQSIYGFRGAVRSGMDRLAEHFATDDMKLSTSFRCPRRVVERARFRVPDMQYAPWAIEGSIHQPDEWTADHIPDGAAIICRHNAPLLSLGFKLIREGRGVNILGFDIGPGLIKTLTKFGPETMTRTELYDAIDKWEHDQLSKTRAKASTSDRADCFRIFAEQGTTLGEAIVYAKHIFQSAGPIQLLSGHKSKGLEWPVVFFLDPWRCKPKDIQTPEEQDQERNVEYVITTRAKEQLWLVNSESFDGGLC
jgi:superfamily I DNA/RNA helicase